MLNRYVCVRQHDAADCGAACLSTVLRHYRLRISIARLREYARTDQRGTTVLGIVTAARKFGFQARGLKGRPEDLSAVDPPFIAHVIKDAASHYVVVHKVTAKHLVIADPAVGLSRVSRAEFVESWSGIVVVVEPGRCAVTARDGSGHRFPLLDWIAPQKHLLAGAAAATMAFTLLGMTGSVFLQLLVDRVIALRNLGVLWRLTAVVIVLSLCRSALGYLRGALIARIGQRIDMSLMLDYFHHVLRLPLRFFETRTTGESLARFSDIVKLRDVIGGSAVVVLVDAATMITGFCFLVYYNQALALLSVLIWMLPLLTTCVANARLRERQRRAMEQAASVQSCLVESLNGIATMKSLCAEQAVFGKAQARIRGLLDVVFRTWMLAVSTNAAGEACASVASLCVLGAAGFMAMEGRMSPGEMVAFYSILSLMLQPVQRLVAVNQAIQDAVIAAERLEDTMDVEEEPLNGAPLGKFKGGIELNGVSFGYGMEKPVVCNVSFTVPPCCVTSIVGPSGSGKSTVAKLLLRLYPPESGSICIGGQELSQISISELRRYVRYVGPDPFLFSGTIRDNLLYGDAAADGDAMQDALCAAGLGWLTELPGYLDIPVGEHGAGFSAGQKQQLSLARALLGEPGVLILDEATSNLDAQADAVVCRHIEALRNRMSVVVIGHALHAGLQVDHVVKMRAGSVIETQACARTA